MSTHVERLRVLREWLRNPSTADALTAAIEALEPPQDTAELRAEVEQLATQAYGDGARVDTSHGGHGWDAEVSRPIGDGHETVLTHPILVGDVHDERTALLMLRGALRARLGR